MNRQELLLATLSTADGRSFTPAQLQKAIFLIDRNLPGIVDNGPAFHFTAYNYGPFDKAVYEEAEQLRASGSVVIAPAPGGRWQTYAASDDGIEIGQVLLDLLSEEQRNYINSVAQWVLGLSFADLVKSIYEIYPEMRANSIFQE